MINKDDLIDALTTDLNEHIYSSNSLAESADELKAMGFRDINDIDEPAILAEAMKNIQIQRTLHDLSRGSSDRRSIRDYLEKHLDFLCRISPGKTKADIVKNLSADHAVAILKTTAKMDVPSVLMKKHLKVLKKKYS